MPDDNFAIVQRIYQAFERGDIEAVIAPMRPDVIWNEADNSPYADKNPYVGPDNIRDGLFARTLAEWDDFRATPEELVGGGDAVVVMGRYSGVCKATGNAVNAQFAHVWRLAGGQISSFQQYTDSAQIMRAVTPKAG